MAMLSSVLKRPFPPTPNPSRSPLAVNVRPEKCFADNSCCPSVLIRIRNHQKRARGASKAAVLRCRRDVQSASLAVTAKLSQDEDEIRNRMPPKRTMLSQHEAFVTRRRSVTVEKEKKSLQLKRSV